jgi:hypothetical protein
MYPDSEILFPPRCIQQLRDLRGPQWQHLIERVAFLPHHHEEVLAFGLMMIKLGSCLTCDLDFVGLLYLRSAHGERLQGG